jgi:hypothetical protein
VVRFGVGPGFSLTEVGSNVITELGAAVQRDRRGEGAAYSEAE